MDKQKFDALTRAFATGTSRRTAIKGIFGGAAAVAVAATRLDRAGAQGTPCTPVTVLDDCPLPDACTQAQCLQGVGTEAYFCSYSGGCDLRSLRHLSGPASTNAAPASAAKAANATAPATL